MDEGGTGKADGVHALMLARAGIIAGLAIMCAAEADMQRVFRSHVRRVWVCRTAVLFNIACAMSQLARADAAPWLLLLTPFSLYCAWYSFRTGEGFAGDLPWMRTALADVREKIKTAMRLANES